MVDPRVRIELQAVAGMVGNLDYYQVLKVQPTAERRAIERAFIAESRKFHPDRFRREGDGEMMELSTAIFRRISEAWSVLRDPMLRSAYDRRRASGQAGERLTRADLEQEVVRNETAGPEAKSAMGRKFLELAKRAERSRDYAQAVLQAQFSVNSEADNEGLKGYLEELRVKAKAAVEAAAEAKADNPYKID